jgi:hypothetical protein
VGRVCVLRDAAHDTRGDGAPHPVPEEAVRAPTRSMPRLCARSRSRRAARSETREAAHRPMPPLSCSRGLRRVVLSPLSQVDRSAVRAVTNGPPPPRAHETMAANQRHDPTEQRVEAILGDEGANVAPMTSPSATSFGRPVEAGAVDSRRGVPPKNGARRPRAGTQKKPRICALPRPTDTVTSIGTCFAPTASSGMPTAMLASPTAIAVPLPMISRWNSASCASICR